MPIYKNTSDTDLDGIVGVGHVGAGETKLVADPIEHTSLELQPDDTPFVLQGIEIPTDEAPTEAEIVNPAPTPPAVPQPAAPVAPAPVAPMPTPAPVNPVAAPVQPENVTPNQGA